MFYHFKISSFLLDVYIYFRGFWKLSICRLDGIYWTMVYDAEPSQSQTPHGWLQGHWTCVGQWGAPGSQITAGRHKPAATVIWGAVMVNMIEPLCWLMRLEIKHSAKSPGIIINDLFELIYWYEFFKNIDTLQHITSNIM